MDKYTESTLFEGRIKYWIGSTDTEDYHTFDKGTMSPDGIVIAQDENINHVKYRMFVIEDNGFKSISKLEIKQDGKYSEIKPMKLKEAEETGSDKITIAVRDGQNVFLLNLDFNNRIDAVRFSFANNFVAPVELPLNFKESSKEAYYQKVEAQNRQALLDASQIKIATGNDLVNIYFNPANDNYASAKIELYTATGNFEQHHGSVIHQGWKPRLLGGNVERLIAKYSVEEGMFFKTITGLAHGVYGIKLIQLDSNNKVIVESDVEFFTIR